MEKTEIVFRILILDMGAAPVILLSHAQFAKGFRMKRKLGYVTIFADREKRTSMVENDSCRCNKVSQPVAATKVQVLFYAYANGYIIGEALN